MKATHCFGGEQPKSPPAAARDQQAQHLNSPTMKLQPPGRVFYEIYQQYKLVNTNGLTV
jgi:hypothetical protein